MQMFKDTGNQRELDRDGAVCIPALNASQIAELTELYAEVKPVDATGIYSNIQDQPASLNFRINAKLIDAFRPFIEQHFTNVKVAGSSFLVKHAGGHSQSQLHQDYTLVDESEFLSLSIWCPLVDVDLHNGCLQVIKGTHNMFRHTLRSLNMPSLYLEFDERLEEHLTAIPVKAGTAVVYAHNLFHGSKPNASDETRFAAVVALTPETAETFHVLKNGENMDVLKVEDRFYCETVPTFRQTGKIRGVEDNTSARRNHAYS